MIRRTLPVQRMDAAIVWVRWAMLLLAPVAALAFDTWLNTEMLRNDYEMALINKQLKELSDTLDGLRVEEARLQTFDRIEIEAPDLGLVAPEPDQIHVIHCTEADAEAMEDSFPYVASLPKPAETAKEGDTTPARRIASLPFEPSRSEDTKWEATEPFSRHTNTTPMGDLLRKAIYSACASSPGDL